MHTARLDGLDDLVLLCTAHLPEQHDHLHIGVVMVTEQVVGERRPGVSDGQSIFVIKTIFTYIGNVFLFLFSLFFTTLSECISFFVCEMPGSCDFEMIL